MADYEEQLLIDVHGALINGGSVKAFISNLLCNAEAEAAQTGGTLDDALVAAFVARVRNELDIAAPVV